jgi:hypothetical protein
MNRASRDESPLRNRRPSNTTASADLSTLVTTGATEYDHLTAAAGAAPTSHVDDGDM